KPDLEPQRFDHAIVQEGAERTWSPRNTTIYDLWQSRFQEGQNALGQGDNPKAEASLEQALALAHRLGSEPTYLTHDALALCYYRQEDYARSRDHQKESIRLAFES